MKKTPTTLPVKRQRRINLRDLEALAELTEALRLNYKEACAVLKIPYESWRNWKDRAQNQGRYDDILARVKGAWLRGRLRNIEDAETGKHGHRPDWRASKALLEIGAPERYAPQAAEPSIPRQGPFTVQQIENWLNRAGLTKSPAPAIVDAQEVKALPESTGTVEDSWTETITGMKNPLPASPPAPAPRRLRSKLP